ncbi:acyltransferase [Ancylostoma ceylanicum]|uniref:Acyltransferase n=1 Tax=Ancylostoma ceylanicum TaxID=53326 RepID=A0A0D6M104_9BILA|nr:acyltransferase [Ancylostoma ceylanicum]
MSQTQCEPDFKVEVSHNHVDANDQLERTASRRNDLQGVRGIAIIAVLLFHFFPKTFPNGHVGVDQFFVLSGFLMSMISNRQKKFGHHEIASFYCRRVKRIAPSYLLVAKAEDLFTHTWSIAVEMQFYLIFPLIFVIYKILLGISVNQLEGRRTDDSLTGVFISIIMAATLTELFEKHYLRADRRIVIYLIVLLYAANIVLISNSDAAYFLDQERKWSAKLFTPVCSRPQPFAPQTCYMPFHEAKISTTQAIRLNELHSFDDERHLWNPLCTYEEPGSPFGWCHLSPQNSTSAQKILIIGNSYATNQGRVIHEMCENSDRKIDIFAKPACEAFAQSAYWYCGDAYKEYVDAVAKYKPDILFMLFRHLSWMDTPKSTDSPIDYLVANASAVLKGIEQHVKSQIFILDAIPRPILEYQKKYHARLRANKPINQRLLFNSSVNVELARWRTQLLVNSCPKCSIIDYTPLFTVNDTFHLVDERTKVAYIDNNMHFTPHGLYQLRTLYKNICDSLPS